MAQVGFGVVGNDAEEDDNRQAENIGGFDRNVERGVVEDAHGALHPVDDAFGGLAWRAGAADLDAGMGGEVGDFRRSCRFLSHSICLLPMIAFARMISLDDKRWTTMLGGYRVPFDPRPLLLKLETGEDAAAAWHELWNELHHQGDVGEVSYAAVPHLVRIFGQRKFADWNTYAMVAIIELSRAKGSNPDVPAWLAEGYFRAISDLAEIGVSEVLAAADSDVVCAILSIIAIAKKLPTHGEFLVEYSEDEMLDFQSRI